MVNIGGSSPWEKGRLDHQRLHGTCYRNSVLKNWPTLDLLSYCCLRFNSACASVQARRLSLWLRSHFPISLLQFLAHPNSVWKKSPDLGFINESVFHVTWWALLKIFNQKKFFSPKQPNSGPVAIHHKKSWDRKNNYDFPRICYRLKKPKRNSHRFCRECNHQGCT